MNKFTQLEVVISADGTVRIYGNGGLVYEAIGENVRLQSSIYPKQKLNSGEGPKTF